MNKLRNNKQREFADVWLNRRNGILLLAPRFGKIFTAINVIESLEIEFLGGLNVFVTYPNTVIKDSWIEDFRKRDYKYDNVTFSTHKSIYKHINNKYDLIIIDEVHLLSDSQINFCHKLIQNSKYVLGLTGTLSSFTEYKLLSELNLPVIVEYSMEEAIKDGIIADYEINIIQVSLDDIIIQPWKHKRYTEKRRANNIQYLIKKKEKEGKSVPFHLYLLLIEVFQKSIAKKNATIKLLEKFKDDRILVFCGRIEIAESLNIPSYHSKSSNDKDWKNFTEGLSNQLAVINIGGSGITYKPLHKVIINYANSNSEELTQRINRAMSIEYDNPDKKAIIYVITSDNEYDMKWTINALEMFEKSKINIINNLKEFYEKF